ncbi:hypothetical protein GCM10010302_05540 [Streptomyces polychromogenes]|uniref:Fibronectin type-III domain-containing protein n=1 Tax=Streptomyces polychromogenes TaxID=67342 RepID=A0ABN0V1N5_9ACTN
MKLGRLMVAAILLAPTPFVGMTESASAAQVHRLTIRGWVNARDGGGIFDAENDRTRNFQQDVTLTHERREASFRRDVCAGNESRAELFATFTLNGVEEVVTVIRLRLYEGSSCSSNDLDGEDYVFLGLKEGESWSKWRLQARNLEPLSFDSATADVTVSHNLGPPPEPSNVVAQRSSSRDVTVTWTDEATSENGYEVTETYTHNSKILPPNATSFIYHIPGPTGPKQCFQVRAIGAQGASDWTPVSPRAECA